MISFKNRLVNYSKPVDIYRNLNAKDDAHKFSIRQKGLVVAHTNQIMLKNCQFVVSKAGQKRVRKQKRKNVHACIRGIITESGMGISANQSLRARITYNPYKDEGFMCHNLTITPFEVKGAKIVVINKNGVSAAYLEK